MAPDKVSLNDWKMIRNETLAKLPMGNHCHSERSKESRIFMGLRSSTLFRMTEKRLLQEAQMYRQKFDAKHIRIEFKEVTWF
jgi:hypothetical protein